MSSEENHGAGTPTTKPNNNDWTVMLYITADGTLTNFAVESLKQLNKAVSSGAGVSGKPSVKVAAHFSFPGGATNPAAAAAGAPASQISHDYIFPPKTESGELKSQPSGPGQVLSLKPARVELSVKTDETKKVDKPKEVVEPKRADKTDDAKMSVKDALKAFLQAVYDNEDLKKSQHFALFLWGHGPELLLRPPAGNSTGDSVSLYLTPEELREVLTECTPPTKDSKLDIIGFDACYMSMLEMADELSEVANYMVASQDEVPDLSFPYENLVGLLREHGDKPDLLVKNGVKVYVETYQDCICNNTTEMNPVTLSALNLNNCDALNNAVKKLANALVTAKNDSELQCLLIQAREKSQDYAGGLYVDLHEFCANLSSQLGELKKKKEKEFEELDVLKSKKQHQLSELTNPDEVKKKQDELNKLELLKANKQGELGKVNTWINGIEPECTKVINALKISEDSLVLVNDSVKIFNDGKDPVILLDPPDPPTQVKEYETRNHGISIYFPYLTDDQYAQVGRPLVKGEPGTRGGKGFSDAINGAAIEYLMAARRDLILDTESYYPRLQLQSDTKWYDFITQVWTRALIKKLPSDLDYHYSAQQSWMNVCRNPVVGL